jgi:hypothetical protein
MRFDISIEIKLADVMEKTVMARKDGRQCLIREQIGWIDIGKPYPQEVRIPVENGKEPYAPGKYTVDPACLYIDRYGKLALGRLRLLAAK